MSFFCSIQITLSCIMFNDYIAACQKRQITVLCRYFMTQFNTLCLYKNIAILLPTGKISSVLLLATYI